MRSSDGAVRGGTAEGVTVRTSCPQGFWQYNKSQEEWQPEAEGCTLADGCPAVPGSVVLPLEWWCWCSAEWHNGGLETVIASRAYQVKDVNKEIWQNADYLARHDCSHWKDGESGEGELNELALMRWNPVGSAICDEYDFDVAHPVRGKSPPILNFYACTPYNRSGPWL